MAFSGGRLIDSGAGRESAPARADTHDWLRLALPAFVLLLLALGAGRLWAAPLSFDEANYYLPAIRNYAATFPRRWFDPPFPGPPTGLIVQLPVYLASGGSWKALRILSTVATAGTSTVVWASLRREGTQFRHAVLLFMICCFPFVLVQAFTFKHHALMLLFLVSGLALWERAVAGEASGRYLLLASLLLTLAVTTNQLAAPVCLALGLQSWRGRAAGPSRVWLARVLAASVPLAVLGTFFLVWKGTIPPAYRLNPVVSRVRFGSVHPAQIFACLLILGLWLRPSLEMDRRSIRRSILLSVPFGLAMFRWGGYRAGVPFFSTIVGPISSTLRALTARSAIAGAVVGGLLCGFGADLLLRKRETERSVLSFEWLAIFYVAMMLLVPYLFESYYTVLFVTACLTLKRPLARDWPAPAVVLHRLMVIVVGVFYAISKATTGAVFGR